MNNSLALPNPNSLSNQYWINKLGTNTPGYQIPTYNDPSTGKPAFSSSLINTKPETGFDWGNAFKNFSMGAQGVLGLANAYNAYKQMKLMEKQYGASLAGYNRDIANQSVLTNKALQERAYAEARTLGYGIGTPEHDSFLANYAKVDGSPIG